MSRLCWEDGPLTEDECGTSCILPKGHEGEHEWTRQDEIIISFVEQPEPPKSETAFEGAEK